MNGYDSSSNHQPLFWLRGHAIYAAYFVVLVFVVSLIATTILMAGNFVHVLAGMGYNSTDTLKGEIWRLFSYGLVNPPSIWFAVDMLLLASFGREFEKFFGRNTFLGLCAGLYFLPSLLFTLIGRWWPAYFSGEAIALAVFVAFATLYPNVVLMFNVLAKWAAVILVGVFTLMALAYHDSTGLVSLWVRTGFAYAFVRYQQGRFTLPSLSFGRCQPRLRLLPDLKPDQSPSAKAPKEESMAEMDALLDKIARSGIASLTAKERAKLEKTRTNLMK